LKKLPSVLLLCLIAAVLAPAGYAAPGVDTGEDISTKPETFALDRKFVLGIAAGVNRFSSNYRFKGSGSIPIYIDGEGLLGLPKSNLVPALYGAWRINRKHSLGFHAFNINRTGSDIAVDRDFGSVSIDGVITASDKSSFYYLNYGYTLKETSNIFVKGLLGVYVLNLKFELDAVGDISIDDVPVVDGQYNESFSQIAPLPMIGLRFLSLATDKWALGAKFAAVWGQYQDVQALVVEAQISARYQLATNVGLIIGANYFNGDIEIDEGGGSSTDIEYGYDGLFLGLDYNF
jgi:hypothetical protein